MGSYFQVDSLMEIIYVLVQLLAFSNVMKEVVKAAEEGKPVLGVCNGFQILLEAGLLPGAMLTK